MQGDPYVVSWVEKIHGSAIHISNQIQRSGPISRTEDLLSARSMIAKINLIMHMNVQQTSSIGILLTGQSGFNKRLL
jgi:hypothetical protein